MAAYSLGTMGAWAVTSNTDQIITGAKTFQAALAATVPLRVKGVASQTGNLQEWQLSDGTLRARVGPGGAIWTDSDIVTTATGSAQFGGANWYGATVNVTPRQTNNAGIVVRGLPGQTSQLQSWQNSAGTQVAAINGNGAAHLGVNEQGVFVGNIGNGGDNAAGLMINYSNLPTVKPIVARGASGQTGNLLELQNSSGLNIVSFEPVAGGVQGAHLRLTNPNGNTNANSDSRTQSPYFLLEGRTWDSAAGNQQMYAGIRCGHQTVNNTAPQSALIFTASRDGALEDYAYGTPDGFYMYGGRLIYTTGTMSTHILGLDYNGDGAIRARIHVYHADAGQISFLENHDADTLYKVLRAGGFSTVSTRESKNSIQTLDTNALDIVKKAKPLKYKYNDDERGLERHGFTAEELAVTYPQAVTITPDGTPTGIDYGALTPLLLKAIQELSVKVEALEAAAKAK